MSAKFLLALAAMTFVASPAPTRGQNAPGSSFIPPPPDAPEDLARRMAERRAQQLQSDTNTAVPPPPQAPAATPPSTAPYAVPTDAHFQELADRLASDDPITRQFVQKDLDALTWHDLDPLRRLTENVSDPKAKSHLADLVHFLEDQLSADPPPISVEFKDATLPEVIDALEKAMGQKFSDPTFRGGDQNVRFTLAVHDKPFWEIFSLLCDQHPLRILSGPTGMRFIAEASGARPVLISGGMAIFSPSLNRTDTIDLQNPLRPTTSSLRIQCAFILDPRMKVSRFQRPAFSEIKDDVGNSLLSTGPSLPPGAWTAGSVTRSITLTESLQIPEKIGKTIAIAKGVFHVEVQLATESFDITDVDKKLNTPLQFAGQTITIRQLEQVGSSFRFSIARTIARARGRGGSNGIEPPITAAVIDSTGQQIASVTVSGSATTSAPRANATPPFKVHLTVGTKSKQLDIPFEFKDLPLP